MIVRWWLLRRLVRRDLRLFGALALLGLVVGTVGGTLALVVGSSRQAVVDGVAGAVAGRNWQIDVIGDQALHTSLLATPGLVALWAEVADIEAGGRLARASVDRYTDPELHIGGLVAGRHPEQAGEVTVSLELAAQLGVDVGDVITMLGVETRGDEVSSHPVVGVHVLEHRRDSRSVELLDGQPRTEVPSLYLTDVDLRAVSPALADAHDRGELIRRETSSTVAFALDDLAASSGAAYRIAAITGTLIILGLLVAGALLAFLRFSLSALALTRVGLSSRSADGLLSAALLVAVVPGVVVGVVLARLLAPVTGAFVGRPANLYWSTPAFSTPFLLATLALPVAAVVATAALRRRTAAVAGERRSVGSARVLAAGASVAVVVGGVLFVLLDSGGPLGPVVDLPAGVLVGLGILALLASAVRVDTRNRRVLSLIRHDIARRTLPLGAAVVVASFLASFATTWIRSEAERERRDYTGFLAGLPAGSFQIERLATAEAVRIADAYRARGGESYRFELIDDADDRIVRVARVDDLACSSLRGGTLGDLLDCPNSIVLSVGTDLNGDPAPPGSLLAAPELINSEGQVALVEADPTTGAILRTELVEAEPAPGFGPALVGALLDDEVRRAWSIEPTGVSTLGLLSLADLPTEVQSEMRAIVRAEAGAAVVNDDRGYQDQGRSTLATVISLLTAVALLLAGVTWGISFGRSERVVGRSLARLVAPMATVAGLYGFGLAALTLSGVIGSVAGYLVASQVGRDYTGVVWLTPALAAALVGVVTWWSNTRPQPVNG